MLLPKRPLDFLALFFLLGLLALPANAGTTYTIINIGSAVDAGSGTLPVALNNAGQAIGLVYGAGTTDPFLFSNGTSELLNVSNFSPTAMNDVGNIVGTTFTNEEHTHAALFRDGTVYDLGTFAGADGPGFDYSFASAINNSGMLTGYADTTNVDTDGNPEEHAFLYDTDTSGPMTDLGTASGTIKSTATGINGKGQIVGLSEDAGGTDEAVLFSGGSVTDLSPHLGSDLIFSSAVGINDGGQILGSAVSSTAGGFSFIYANGKVEHTGEMTGSGINSQGQVAGSTSNEDNSVTYAAVYINGTVYKIQDLVPAGQLDGFASLDDSYAINDDGLILGSGTLENGMNGTFLAVPSITLAGTHDGIATASGVNVGYVNISIDSKDDFKVALDTPEKSYTFSGKFPAGNAYSGPIKISRTVSLQVSLTRNLAASTVSGSINDGTTTFNVLAKEYGSYNAKQPPPYEGSYTAVLPPANSLPPGQGWAAMSVNASGIVHLAGKLADEAALNYTGHLHKDGTFALYEKLYAGKHPGAIVGEVTFETKSTSDCDAATLEWTKPPQINAKGLYTSGFSGAAALAGAKFSAPALAANGYNFEASGGGITAIQHAVTVSSKGVVKVINPSADKLAFKVDMANGTYAGSFHLPGEKSATSFSGVIYQKSQATSGGVFLGPSAAGVVAFPQ